MSNNVLIVTFWSDSVANSRYYDIFLSEILGHETRPIYTIDDIEVYLTIISI